jgi:hypothetical protein
MRALYSMGLLFIALCGGLLWLGRAQAVPAAGVPAPPAGLAPHPVSQLTGPEWFRQMKPFCNPVEVETRVRYQPPPPGYEGVAYGAGCFALAGKIARARELLLTLEEAQRQMAADVVFELAHPVADAGDDASAGPIMGLVVEFSAYNYMALYHAGASEFALGQSGPARTHLTRFLELYQSEDGWRGNARSMLARLDAP